MEAKDPILLYLETADKNCSVALSKGEELLCLCEENDGTFSHSKKLHTFIEWALEGAELEMNQIDAVVIDGGPGSYTGLRIGTSAAKGICYSLGLPLLALNSLDILCYSDEVENQDFDLIIPMLDARRDEVYCKVLDSNLKEVSATEAKILSQDSFLDYHDKKILLIGAGAEKAQYLVSTDLNSTFLPQIELSAKHMIKPSLDLFNSKSFEDVAYYEPYYLKDFAAGKPKKLI